MRPSESRQQLAAIQVSHDKKPRLKYKPYHTQSNVSINTRLSSHHSQKIYQIQLNSLADPHKSLGQLFSRLYSSIFQAPQQQIFKNPQGDRLILNKLFLFAIDCFLLNSKFKKDPQNSQNQNVRIQLEELVNAGCLEQGNNLLMWIQKRLQNYVKEAVVKIERLKGKQDEPNFRVSELPGAHDVPRVKWKVQQIFLVYQKLKRNLLQQVLGLSQQRKRRYIPNDYFGNPQLQMLYLERMSNTLFELPLVPRAIRISQIENFINNNRDYLRASFIKEEYPSNNRKKFAICRYTNTDRLQILSSLGDLVKLRKNETSNTKDNYQVAKAIIVELIKFKKITSQAYALLTPESILFNQLSLKVQLSYQNILYSYLGLNFRPMSIQQKICFQPTPQPFDTFSAPFQYDQVKRLKMYHFFKEQQSQIKASVDTESPIQIWEANQLLKKSEVWRCLMIISYFLNGKQFYDQKFGNPKIRQNRLDFAQSTYSRLISDEYFYKQICGDQFISWLTKDSQPKYIENKQSQFLEQLLNTQNEYSIIKHEIQSFNIKSYIKAMHDMTKLLLETLENQNRLKSVPNAIKYMVRFYAYILIKFRFCSLILQKYNELDAAKAVIFQRVFKAALNINKADQRQTSSVDVAVLKLKQYQEAQNRPIVYIKTNYKQQYSKLLDLHEKYLSFREKFIKAESIYEQQRNIKKLIEFYYKNMSRDYQIIAQEIPYIKQTLRKIVQKEFVIILSQPSSEYKGLKEFKKLRITLIMQSLLTIDLKNLQFIRSLIIPLIVTQIPTDLHGETPALVQFCNRNNELMDYSLQVLWQMNEG